MAGRGDDVRGEHFLVLGAGGLGSPALLGLVAAGARRITIVDRDRVDASNLQRQVLFDLGDVGALKAEAAARSLRRRDRRLEVRPIVADVDEVALHQLLAEAPPATVVLECSDDPGLKFMVNDACLSGQVTAVIAGAQRWRGQALAVARGAGACLRCIFEAAPPVELDEGCAEVGVMGPAVGVFGGLMALLAWRCATEGSAIAGTLIALDLLRLQIHTLRPPPRPACPACAGLGIQDDARRRRACSATTPTPTTPPPLHPPTSLSSATSPRKTTTIMATVHIPTPLRKYTQGKETVAVSGATVSEILGNLEVACPGIRERICDESGKLRRFVNVFVADEDIRHLQQLETQVRESDEISIVPAIAGG